MAVARRLLTPLVRGAAVVAVARLALTSNARRTAALRPPPTPIPVVPAVVRPGRLRRWAERSPVSLVYAEVLLAVTAALWIDAGFNRFRFNVVLAAVASVVLLALLVIGARKVRDPKPYWQGR